VDAGEAKLHQGAISLAFPWVTLILDFGAG
jgi:hypothetical protein